MELEIIIGLEIHVELKTKSKMFCSCDNTGENKPANSCICPVCLGHPGTLPVANKKAIEWSAKTALAINCEIDEYSKFDRKHYFYPDLPKAYQISQLDQPIGKNGYLMIMNPESKQEEKLRINRLHLEEDAAKLTHPSKKDHSLVDYNRGGTPLMEVVTEPDINSPAQAKLFLQELRQIIRYLEVSDADMEKGHLRCDANISLRPLKDNKLYPKTEIKNLNSFKAVEKALEYEISRQTKLWLEGDAPKEETTRGWNENKSVTEAQRSKEKANDYRYFPEPDIPPIKFSLESENKCQGDEIIIAVNCLKAELPELPYDKRKRFIGEYRLNFEDVKILTENKHRAAFTEATFSELRSWIENLEEATENKKLWEENNTKLIQSSTNWLINNLFPYLDEQELTVDTMKLNPENMAELISLIFANKLNSNAALEVLKEMVKTGGDASHIMRDKNLGQISDTEELETIIDKIIKDNPKPVKDYKNGKENALQSLVGQTMGKTKGKANPQIVLEILKKKLK